MLTTVGVTAFVWLVFGSAWPLLPLRWFVTLVHEAGHAVMATAVGGHVSSVTMNTNGGGLTGWSYTGGISDFKVVVVSSAGYVGTAVVGGVMLELATRVKQGKVALISLAVLVAAICVAWVPWNTDPQGIAAQASGSSSGDGRFTILFCIAAVGVFLLLAGVRFDGANDLRRTVVLALATVLCFASIDDLRTVLDISSRGGHSDAAIAAGVTPLSSWMWSILWLLAGVIACGVGLWAALHGDDDKDGASTAGSIPRSTL